MHPNNKHNIPYDFERLIQANSELKPFVFTNNFETKTINFSLAEAVYQLNKAILISDYGLTDYQLPKGYLCPPIPGRADYLHHLNDLIIPETKPIKGLDIGVGANAIYPILGVKLYQWNMVGADINKQSVEIAQNNINLNSSLDGLVEIRFQENPAHIFSNIIKPEENYHFTMCNPPFHASEQEALKGTQRKLKNLNLDKKAALNFGGQSHELWCNGGEALFIKRLIKESKTFSNQVGWFTTLVSKAANIPKLIKQLDKLGATHQIIDMAQGQKVSRILAWQFTN
ncbi:MULTISPECIES: 23S rRNA (adenine(1618)-N(6))-methyltransferase RlmF [Bizionia]|uniref:Ribosomal RNA large subunit methyltransferase F n=1 Tax=Bizionia algoritergicola TaxID=291187 RepID=A0A5D0QXP1_9FLAO|nr:MULTISPECIES: 23S rRNA (adenine(1618)-N(6))-methyltransferase RlmF [Bizionia]OBX24045.1 23S rRNA (adenine(1618)-N(6))-methyltransferase [Bizionia sp. APA-3]TYB73555.1 23S rRNA (adenine(1618)-N(6))-methyltransferase RlmF [Bizionia algoritergicola]